MGKRSPDEQTWFELKKAATAAIRLRHTLAADREINEVIHELQTLYEASLKGGPVFEFDTADLVRELS